MNLKWNYRLAELVEDWAFYSRTYSWSSSLLNVSRELLALPYRHIHYFMFERSLTDPLPVIKFDGSIMIRRFKPQDIPEVAEINRPSEARLCARRLDSGQVGLSAIYDNHLVGYAWACTSIEPNIERININLGPGDFLCNDDFTSPPFRGHGIQTSLIFERFRIFKENGFRKAICYIEIHNKPSQHAYEKVGSRQVGEIDFFRVGSRRWVKISLQSGNLTIV